MDRPPSDEGRIAADDAAHTDSVTRPPPPRSPGWLGPLNFLALQWLGVRLRRRLYFLDGSPWYKTEWSLRRWVMPLTGWWSGYLETRGAR